MIKDIKCYQTDDGQLFQIKKEALVHQASNEFIAHCNLPGVPIVTLNGEVVRGDTLLEWLIENKNIVLQTLSVVTERGDDE